MRQTVVSHFGAASSSTVARPGEVQSPLVGFAAAAGLCACSVAAAVAAAMITALRRVTCGCGCGPSCSCGCDKLQLDSLFCTESLSCV